AAGPGRVDSKTRRVADAFRKVLEALELDLDDPNLAGTHLRIARAYNELFAGLESEEPRLRTFPNRDGYSEMVTVLDVPFYSLCAHHFLPFFGAFDDARVRQEFLSLLPQQKPA